MTDKELLQQALDALEDCGSHSRDCPFVFTDKDCNCGLDEATEAIRTRLAQPEQIDKQGQSMTYWGGLSIKNDYERGFIDGMAKQTQSSVDKAVNAMSKKEWVGLTDDEIDSIAVSDNHEILTFARAIEAKLKEKNT